MSYKEKRDLELKKEAEEKAAKAAAEVSELREWEGGGGEGPVSQCWFEALSLVQSFSLSKVTGVGYFHLTWPL